MIILYISKGRDLTPNLMDTPRRICFTSGNPPKEEVNTYLDTLPTNLSVMLFRSMCKGSVLEANLLYSSGIFSRVLKQREFWDILHKLAYPNLEYIPDKFKNVSLTHSGQWTNNHVNLGLAEYAAQCKIRDLDRTLDVDKYKVDTPFAIEICTGNVDKLFDNGRELFSWTVLTSLACEKSLYEFICGLEHPPQVVTICHKSNAVYTFVVTFFVDTQPHRWIIPVDSYVMMNMYFILYSK
jgi:hypothetical protein